MGVNLIATISVIRLDLVRALARQINFSPIIPSHSTNPGQSYRGLVILNPFTFLIPAITRPYVIPERLNAFAKMSSIFIQKLLINLNNHGVTTARKQLN